MGRMLVTLTKYTIYVYQNLSKIRKIIIENYQLLTFPPKWLGNDNNLCPTSELRAEFKKIPKSKQLKSNEKFLVKMEIKLKCSMHIQTKCMKSKYHETY